MSNSNYILVQIPSFLIAWF